MSSPTRENRLIDDIGFNNKDMTHIG